LLGPKLLVSRSILIFFPWSNNGYHFYSLFIKYDSWVLSELAFSFWSRIGSNGWSMIFFDVLWYKTWRKSITRLCEYLSIFLDRYIDTFCSPLGILIWYVTPDHFEYSQLIGIWLHYIRYSLFGMGFLSRIVSSGVLILS